MLLSPRQREATLLICLFCGSQLFVPAAFPAEGTLLRYRFVPGQRLRYRVSTEITATVDYGGREAGETVIRTADEVVFTVRHQDGKGRWVLDGDVVPAGSSFVVGGHPVSVEGGRKRRRVTLTVAPGGVDTTEGGGPGGLLAAGFFPPLPDGPVPEGFSWPATALPAGGAAPPIYTLTGTPGSRLEAGAAKITVSGGQQGELFFLQGVLVRGTIRGSRRDTSFGTAGAGAEVQTAYRWRFNLAENSLPQQIAP